MSTDLSFLLFRHLCNNMHKFRILSPENKTVLRIMCEFRILTQFNPAPTFVLSLSFFFTDYRIYNTLNEIASDPST